MTFDLTGRVALVTGASGGIGGAIARDLVAGGARVVVSGTRHAALQALAADLGDSAVVAPCDLSDMAAVDALPAQAAQAAGQAIDILVNNAGITRDNLAMRMKDEEWDTVLQVNLTAGFHLARALLRGMLKARWGRIISITSVVAATGNAGQANYAAAKAGVTGLTKALAQEVAARQITVNCVAPGFIRTAMTDGLGEDRTAALLSAIPAGRLGQPEDVAGAVRFLASEQAAYITGQTLHVNGGMAMI
ncbi:MAG: 3-oxoacyl-[acyl-carrier-protein] reductase [Alphaproteobacteria bacterium]